MPNEPEFNHEPTSNNNIFKEKAIGHTTNNSFHFHHHHHQQQQYRRQQRQQRLNQHRHKQKSMNRVHPTLKNSTSIKDIPSVSSSSSPGSKYQHHYSSGGKIRSDDDFKLQTEYDDDISFLRGYARYVTTELSDYELQNNDPIISKAKSIEIAYQILMIFQDFPHIDSFHRRTRHQVFQFIDRLMENYGMQFLDMVTELLLKQKNKMQEDKKYNIQSLFSSIDVEANLEKKTIVFIEDNPPSLETSRLARMLIVSLICCNVQPIVIPCNDLESIKLESVKLKLTQCYSYFSKSTNDINRDYRTLLKIGFLSSLENTEQHVIIFDVDRRLKDYNDFIAEAEYRGHQLLFMRYHNGINKIKFVQKIIQKILSKCCLDDVRLDVNLTRASRKSTENNTSTNQDVILQVDPQEYRINVSDEDDGIIPIVEHKDSLLRTFYKYLTEHLGKLPSWFHHSSNLFNHHYTSNSNDNLEILQSTKSKKSKNILPFTWKEQNLQLQHRLFSFSNLFHGTPHNTTSINGNEITNASNNVPQQQKLFNRNILPRFTDEQFDRIFLAPKLYARQCEEMENKLFSHTRRDLDDLDEIFTNSIPSTSASTNRSKISSNQNDNT